MTTINHPLFAAFREDHSKLGRTLHELRARLVARDILGARSTAEWLNQIGGAHIAFEEEDFYPSLGPFLSAPEIAQMYKEHRAGENIIAKTKALGRDGPPTTDKVQSIIDDIDTLEYHVSECGELFGALGGLKERDKDRLYSDLMRWRKRAPTWRDYAGTRSQTAA